MYSRFYQTPYSAPKSQPQVYPEDIQCVVQSNHPTAGNIYIGNLQASQNIKTLKKHNIKAVLTAASGILLNHPKHQIPHHKYVPGEDHQNFDLSKYFQQSIQFLDDVLEKTNVLVHCMAGVSRSVTLVLAYLIKRKGHSYQSAYSLVKSRRKIIHPNEGFIQQLRKFQRYQSNNSRRIQSPGRVNYQTRKYEYPQQLRKEIGKQQINLRRSNIHDGMLQRQQHFDRKRRTNSSFGQLRYSKYASNTKQTYRHNEQDQGNYGYENQQQLDMKIAQIRKKYDNLTENYNNHSKTHSKLRHANSYYENNDNRRVDYKQYGNNYQNNRNNELKNTDYYKYNNQFGLKRGGSLYQNYENKSSSRQFYDSSIIGNRLFGQSSRIPFRKMVTMNEYASNSKYLGAVNY